MEKSVASVSFGKDSTAMLFLIFENNLPLDEVVFYDTGAEFQAIYNVRDRMIPLIEAYGAEFVELHPPREFFYDMLEKPVRKRNGSIQYGYGWCGGSCRWGTTYKTRTIDKYVGDVNAYYVGIAKDEANRLERLSKPKRAVLAEYDFTEKDALQLCRANGISWDENGIDLYDVLDRVSCWCCRNKNLKELRAMKEYLPQYFEKLVELEEEIGVPMKNGRKLKDL